MIFATLLRIMAGSKQPFDTVGSNSKMILSSFPFLFFFPLLPYFLSRTFSNSLFSHLYTYIYTSFLSLSLSLPTLAELFSLFIFSHFSLSHSPSLFGQPTPATAGTAIYTRPADSEAVRRNKSRLLYKCCQQNRNIAFAYQLFAVQFTRAGGGRQETGGFRERWRPEGKGREAFLGGMGAYNTRWGEGGCTVCSCTLQINSPPRHLYYDLSQLPASLLETAASPLRCHPFCFLHNPNIFILIF